MVQEAVGCSRLTLLGIVNQGGSSVKDNPACYGNYKYVVCPDLRNAAAQISESNTLGVPASPNGWCLADRLAERECRALCDTMFQVRVLLNPFSIPPAA